jgi:hypothetical protein
MGLRGGIWGAKVLIAAGTVVFAFGTSVAQAASIVDEQHQPPSPADGWQAGTCQTDLPECSAETPSQFFTQAAGHPSVGFTQFIVKHTSVGPLEFPLGNIKDLRVDLPLGLSVNSLATEQCVLGKFEESASNCPAGSQVGTSAITVSVLGIPAPPTPPLTLVAVYNLVPANGEPALFGFNAVGSNVFLRAGIDTNGAYREKSGDYHEYFTIEAPIPPAGLILKDRLVFNGEAGSGTFLTTPSTCHNPESAPFEHLYSTYLRADSYEEEEAGFPNGSPFIESPLAPHTMPTGCAAVPFKPSVSVRPETTKTDYPDGSTVEVKLPFEPGSELANSDLKDARVTLPSLMGLNPSAATGLGYCSSEQLGKGTANPVSCPASSKIGTVSIDSPLLPDGSLSGNVYLGQQLSRDPTSGNEYRIFVDAESSRYAISVRLIGNVSANPQTGQLTATFSENPQAPFSSFVIKFDGGPTAALSSPPTCGPNTTTTQMVPWTEGPDAFPGDGFTLTSAPGGGACAKTLAERPFAPSFSAKTKDPNGGAYSEFDLGVGRAEGNQELKGISVDLPPGLSAKLAGLTYCPPAAIAAASAASAAAELAKFSCPDSSLIGGAVVSAGSGPAPIQVNGKVFLAGPYNGAPLSLVVLTPATAGTFDLGTVVVRVALQVDPETAQVHAVSDPIPHVFGGALLDIRSVSVHLDRKQFVLNPTNCSPMALGATLRGGGSEPTNPADFSSDPVLVPFQVKGCESLGFAPKFYFRLFGGIHRSQSPRLQATLRTREGDANISRVSVHLPPTLILKQSSLSKICTRVQFAADACPGESVYGFARAFTPLLAKPLQGPVYLRSDPGGKSGLPDLVAALNGQIDVDLVGLIDTVKGGIRNRFETIPDVPVSKFTLTVRGGGRGLLVNTSNLCQKRSRAIVRVSGQNGKKANQRPAFETPCKRYAKRHRKRR